MHRHRKDVLGLRSIRLPGGQRRDVHRRRFEGFCANAALHGLTGVRLSVCICSKSLSLPPPHHPTPPTPPRASLIHAPLT